MDWRAGFTTTLIDPSATQLDDVLPEQSGLSDKPICELVLHSLEQEAIMMTLISVIRELNEEGHTWEDLAYVLHGLGDDVLEQMTR